MKNLCVTLCLIALLFAGLLAKAEGIYRVNGVKVSVVSTNAKKAKAEAIDKVQIEAFRELLQQAELPEEFYSQHKIEILGAAREYQIISESIAKSSYSGIFDVYFSQSHVNDLLAKAGLGPSELQIDSFLMSKKSKKKSEEPIIDRKDDTNATFQDAKDLDIGGKLIIPLCSLNGKIILWDDNNPWLNQWKTMLSTAEENSIIVPIGDLEDINDTKFNPLMARYKSFSKILEKYSANEVLITLADIKKSRGVSKLSISMKSLSNEHEHSYLKQYFELSGAAVPEMLNEAFYKVLNTNTNNQFDIKSLEIQISDNIEVEALYNPVDFADWTKLSHELGKVPTVKKVSLVEFNGQTIIVSIIFKSNLDDFRKNLNKRGYNLFDADGRFVIKKG